MKLFFIHVISGTFLTVVGLPSLRGCESAIIQCIVSSISRRVDVRPDIDFVYSGTCKTERLRSYLEIWKERVTSDSKWLFHGCYLK